MEKDSKIAGDTVKEVRGVPFQKGDDPRRNLEGRPKGSNNFETDFDEAVDEIAKENGMTRSEARKLLLKVAFKNAKEGNYSFYKDIHDRIYGQAQQKIENTGNIAIQFADVFNKDVSTTQSPRENNTIPKTL